MAELIEYSLVVMISTLFVAGSAAAYTSFSSWEGQLQFAAEFSGVTALASQALANGNSTGRLSLPVSTITCAGGVLTVASGTMARSQDFPVRCDFESSVSPGLHVLRFDLTPSGLGLAVN